MTKIESAKKIIDNKGICFTVMDCPNCCVHRDMRLACPIPEIEKTLEFAIKYLKLKYLKQI
ncbi:MAG: hypothetical protein ABSG25_09705 [Bryobacteraceae bacterium]